jgi:hypothetical protein
MLLSKHVSQRCVLLVAVVATMACLLSAGAHATGDANQQATCLFKTEASPGFRSFLPDCRAYELVTPPYTGGQYVLWELEAPPPVSADGEHILGVALAGFAGAGNVEEAGFGDYGAIYEFSRTSSGWSTESLEPPASQYARRVFQAASADLSRSLWTVVVQAKESEEVGVPEVFTFAVREVVDGRAQFVGVGPAEPPGAQPSVGGEHELQVAGASRDLSHIVLAVESKSGQLWPGDGTREGDESLYEYVGTDNSEPTLVGVNNPGPLEGATHRNEGAKLVSECGTRLGSAHEASTYNAISASGAVVYFTALHREGCSGSQPTVNQLYARINGSQTVAVSEPAMTPTREAECSGVCREDENEENGHTRSPALFEGASEDGSEVFFSTDQPLLNGDKDSARDLYEAEVSAAGVTRLVQVSAGDETDPNRGSGAEVASVVRISEDGSHVYYVARGALTTTPNGNREHAEDGAYNLYVYDTNTSGTAFVANLMTAAEAQAVVTQATAERNSAIEAEEAECERFFGQGRKERGEACEAEVKRLREALPGEVAKSLAEEVGSRTGVTPNDNGYNGTGRPFEATPDGRFLLFTSARQLTGGEDTSTVGQLFEYDTQDERVVRVSIGQCPAPATACAPGERFNANGNTTSSENRPMMLAPKYANNLPPTEASSALSLSEAGAVVFRSQDPLTPLATGGRENIYEYREGEVYLISPGDEAASLQGTGMPRLLGTNQSGRDVFFFTADSVVPQDADTQASWYDAREGGGFPAPVVPPACGGDACQGPVSAAPATPSGGSTGIAEGNLAPPLSKPVVKPKPLTRTQKLAKARHACRKKKNRKRAVCEKQAQRAYGAAKKASRDRKASR